MIRSYSRLIAFSFALLIGVQIPTVFESNVERITKEVAVLDKKLSKVKKKADQEFYGSVDSLIEFYLESDDQRLVSQGQKIASIHNEYQQLISEQRIFQQSLPFAAKDLLLNLKKKQIKTLLIDYDYKPRLTFSAIFSGLACAIIFALLVESILGLIAILFRPVFSPSVNRRSRRANNQMGRHF